MANFSGTHSNGRSEQGESSVPTSQHRQAISTHWTSEEKAILQEGLLRYASKSVLIRYLKIAARLHNKSVRDVAFRCKWMMAKKETSKRRKRRH